MQLRVRVSVIGVNTVLSPSGDIDLATLPDLQNTLARHLHDHRGGKIILDLDEVTVCDDAGLGLFLGSAGRLRQGGGELVVVCSGGPLRTRLADTGFDRAVQVESTITAAACR